MFISLHFITVGQSQRNVKAWTDMKKYTKYVEKNVFTA